MVIILWNISYAYGSAIDIRRACPICVVYEIRLSHLKLLRSLYMSENQYFREDFHEDFLGASNANWIGNVLTVLERSLFDSTVVNIFVKISVNNFVKIFVKI